MKSKRNGPWVPAAGGTEPVFTSRTGKRMQYVFQPSTGRHAYLDVDTDLIMDDEDARRHIEGRAGGKKLPFTRSVLSGDYDQVIVEAMARVMFVDDWARREEQKKGFRGWNGAEIMNVAPATSRDAKAAANVLADRFKRANGGQTLTDLYAKALAAGGRGDAHTFGHYLALEAMGQGVSWFDDNPEFPIHFPHFEYYQGFGAAAQKLGYVEGVSLLTHLLAGGIGYGIARAVEKPEETRALALRAGEKIRAEGRRAYASAKTIAGRAGGLGPGSPRTSDDAFRAIKRAKRKLDRALPKYANVQARIDRALAFARLGRSYAPETKDAYEVARVLEDENLLSNVGGRFRLTALGQTVPLSDLSPDVVRRVRESLEG